MKNEIKMISENKEEPKTARSNFQTVEAVKVLPFRTLSKSQTISSGKSTQSATKMCRWRKPRQIQESPRS
jgi:hypothetical protein